MSQSPSTDQPHISPFLKDPVEQALQLLSQAVEQRKTQRSLDDTLFNRLLETAPDPTLAINAQGDIVFLNSQVEALFGYQQAELLGHKVETLIPERFHLQEAADRADFAAHPRRRTLRSGADLYARRKDGTEFPIEISLSPFETENGMLMVSSIRDISEQKRADRLAAIVDNAEGAIMGKNLNGTIVAWNHGAERLYGYSADEIVGKSLAVLLLPAQINAFPALLERIARGEKIDEQTTSRVRKDGTLVQVSVVESPICDQEGRVIGFSSVSYDISKRKQTEEAAQRHTAKMAEQAALLDLAHDAIFVRDLANSQILFWNKGSRELYGWSEPEALRDTSHNLLKTIFPYPLAEIERQLFQTGRWDGELIQKTAAGSLVTVSSRWALQRNEAHIPVSILEINRDISTQKKAEKASLDANTRLQMALKGGQIGTWTLDLQTNTTIWDTNAPRMFGLPATLLTTSLEFILGLIHPDDIQNVNTQINRALESGHYDVEYRVVWPDGSVHFIAAAGDTIYEGGKPAKLTGACWDITDRKAAETTLRLNEARLKEANYALEQSNRELEHFASIASHDLQEPLRKVQAFGDRLKNGYAANLDATGLDYLNRMLNAAQRMQTLVNDLLVFSRITSHNRPLVPTNLADVAQEVISDLEILITEARAVVKMDPLPIIEADPLLMRQLFQNLIGNALKFQKPDEPPSVQVRAEIGITTCSIIVEDNGIGFDEKYLDKIFTIFQRLHGRSEYAGTGIGLAVCRKIAQRHGGDITARSTPGHGATFVVTLPYKTPARTP